MTKQMSDDYYQLMGSKALDLGRVVSRELSISDADFAELKSISYEEMLQHPLYLQLKNIFSGGQFSREVKSAYLWSILEPEEAKYTVAEGDEDYYDIKPGTPLDTIWLLEVVVNDYVEEELLMEEALLPNEEFIKEEMEAYYRNDKHRYTVTRPSDYELYENPRELYVSESDQFGDVIIASVPMYTTENHLMGYLNVDMFYDAYQNHIAENRNNFALLFILPSLLLTFVYIAISIKRAKQNKLEVSTDPMTGLYNRRHLDDTLPKFVKNASLYKEYLSAIMIDVDCFKAYNDNYGHKAGDSVIINIATAIRSAVHKDSDCVYRYGGEEILVLLPNTPLASAERMAQKIQQSIKELGITHSFSGVESFITVSQGIYTAIPESNDSKVCSAYIEHADASLYAAKSAGRNCYKIYETE
ncbi:MAG: GGDEF domain-containing protein [Anaerovoracaceae bacterium]